MFGPSGDERPDVLTDAETVVLPVWLHHRPSVEKASPESLARFLKSITVPAQAGEPTVTEPETRRRVTGRADRAGAEPGMPSPGGAGEPAAGPGRSRRPTPSPGRSRRAGAAAENRG